MLTMSRIDLLTPSALPPKIVSYAFALSQRDNDLHTLRQEISPQITPFRPRRIMTNVARRGQVVIDGLYIGEINQLAVTNFDAYGWSYEYVKEVQLAFMREHHLFSHEQMYAYCEEHDIEVPDPTRVRLATIEKSTAVRLVGKFLDVPADFTFVLQVIGDAYER